MPGATETTTTSQATPTPPPGGGAAGAGSGAGGAPGESAQGGTGAAAASTTSTFLGPGETKPGVQDGAQGAGKQEAAAGDGKAAGDAGKAQEKPAEDELKLALPKGVEANPALLDKFKPLAKELGLKSDGAQKLLDLHLEVQNAMQEQGREAWTKQVSTWESALKTDKEIGGKEFEANQARASALLKHFGDSELTDFLKSGYGNHPALARFVVKVAKALGEDSAGIRTSPASQARTEEELARLRYPKTYGGQ
jgi:hypothetical protein